MTNRDKDKCEMIADKFGYDSQASILQEECAELIQALSKHRRYNDVDTLKCISEEMADVYIMLEQIKHLLNNENRVKWYIDYKLKRTIGRMEADLD